MNIVPLLKFVSGVGCAAALICCGGGTQSEAILVEGVDAGSDAAKAGLSTACCPHDTMPSGCTKLGGKRGANGCVATCDFWCSTNWRVATDEDGCEVLRYDIRSPQAGETSYCLPALDAGETDAR